MDSSSGAGMTEKGSWYDERGSGGEGADDLFGLFGGVGARGAGGDDGEGDASVSVGIESLIAFVGRADYGS